MSDFLTKMYLDFTKNAIDFFKSRASIDLTDSNTATAIESKLYKNSTIFLAVLSSSILIYLLTSDPNSFAKRSYMYTFIGLMPIFVAVIINSDLFLVEKTSSQMIFFMIGFAIIAFTAFGYFYSGLSPSSLVLFNYIGTVILALIIIVALALVYFIFINYLKRQTGILGFIINLIFYIPCLLTDFIQYIKSELQLTPNIVVVLFFIEIILIILYFTIPLINNAVSKLNKNILLKDPVFLSEQITIAGSDHFKINTIDNSTEDNYQINNYAVSFWMFINANGIASNASASETTIFDFAGGRPKVTYLNSVENPNTFRFYLSNNHTATYSYELPLELQKWHNVVVNYKDGSVDLFINGTIVRSLMLDDKNRLATGTANDVMTVGSINGLSGAICNVNYFNQAVTSSYISSTYNLKMFNNPPV